MRSFSAKTSFPRSAGQLLCAVPLALSLLTGCNQGVNLDDVEKYAQTADAAAPAFDDIAQDYSASCYRRRSFVAEPAVLAGIPLSAELAPGYRSVPSLASAQKQPLSVASLMSVSDCKAEEGVSREWSDRNRIILDYVRSLASLAEGKQAPRFDALGSVLAEKKMITDKQSDAFSKLADVIASEATQRAREEAIIRAAVSAREPLHDAIAGLERVDEAYADLLDAEFADTQQVYNERVCDELLSVSSKGGRDRGRCFLPDAYPKRIPSATRLRVQTLLERFGAVARSINAKRESTVAYAQTLEVILSTNDDLASIAGKRVAFSDIAAVLKRHANDAVNAAAALRKEGK